MQSSEQRKVCLNKAQISKLLRAYQWMTNPNLETAFLFTSLESMQVQAGLLILLVRQAARDTCRQWGKGRLSAALQEECRCSLQCNAPGFQGPVLTSQPAFCRQKPCTWLNTEQHESGLNELEMKLAPALEWLLKDKLYLNWLKTCQYKVKTSSTFSTKLNQRS